MTADMKKMTRSFYVHTKVDTCAKFQLSRFIFIFINCYQLSTAFDNRWQLMTADMKKFQLSFYIHTNVDTCAKFQLSRLIFIFNNCFHLLTDIDSWWQLIWKKINRNFRVYTKVDVCQISALPADFHFHQLSSGVISY